jgi:hypothetical protein
MNVNELRARYEPAWRTSYPHLVRLIRERKLEAGVLLGVAFGGLAEAVCDETEVGELVGVDPYQPGDAFGQTSGADATVLENVFWFAMGRVARFGSRYGHLRATSGQAALMLNVPLDFVFLDPSLPPGGVVAELTLWYPKLRTGGVIGGAASGGGVQTFFASRGMQVSREADGAWWVERRD